jgi:hypothetical protein
MRGVVADLEQRARRLVERLEVRLDLVGVRAHRAELEAGERLAADPRSPGAVQHRTARREVDGRGDDDEDRAEREDEQQRADDVEGALEEEVEAVEHGGRSSNSGRRPGTNSRGARGSPWSTGRPAR